MGECTPTNYLPPDGDDRVCQHFRRKICWWVWACDVGRCTWTNSTILSEAFTSCVDKNDNNIIIMLKCQENGLSKLMKRFEDA